MNGITGTMWNFADTATEAAGAADTNPAPAIFGNPMFLMIVVIAIMFFFSARSQKRQAAKRQQMLDSLVKGTRVLLSSGMYGDIVEVKEKSFVVEIAENVRVEVLKNGVAEVPGAEGEKAEKK